jgi:hypothetical protein
MQFLGVLSTPYINSFANSLTSFPQTDVDVDNLKNNYPGDDFCRYETPHSLWHEQSANGLLELVFFCQAMADFIK